MWLMAGAPKPSTSTFERRAFTHAAGFPCRRFYAGCTVLCGPKLSAGQKAESLSLDISIPVGCSVARTTVVNSPCVEIPSCLFGVNSDPSMVYEKRRVFVCLCLFVLVCLCLSEFVLACLCLSLFSIIVFIYLYLPLHMFEFMQLFWHWNWAQYVS